MDSNFITDDVHMEGIVLESQDPLDLGKTTTGTVDYGLLLEAIQGFEYLYDLSNKLYKDTKKKAQAWQQISELLNCSVEECMKAWKNLRDRFVKEKNRLSSGAEAPQCNWPYYNPMLFYSKFTKPRKTYTSTAQKRSQPPSRGSSVSRASSCSSVWSLATMETLTSPESRPASCGAAEVITSADEVDENSEAVPGPSGLNHRETTVRPSSEVPTSRQISKKSTSRQSETPTSSHPSETPNKSPAQSRKRRKVDQEGNLDNIMGLANSIVHKLEARAPVPRSANSTFVNYIYEELEKMTEEEAKRKRKEILELLFAE